MNILCIGHRIRKCVEKELDKIPLDDPDYNDTYKKTEELFLKRELRNLRKDIEYAKAVREILESEGMISHSREPRSLPEKWCLITIRPDETPNIPNFHDALRCGLAKALFLDYMYAFEQKGESTETMGQGFHVHILAKVTETTRVQNIVAALQNKRSPLSKYNFVLQVGNGRNKFIPDETGYQRALNYIRGEKHNDAKKAACDIDIIWRRANNLEPLYTKPNQVRGLVQINRT